MYSPKPSSTFFATRPNRLRGSWQALGFTIAHNKAVSAIRAARAGLRGTDHRESLHLIPIDTPSPTQDGTGRAIDLRLLPTDVDDPEEAYIKRQQSLLLRDFAREVLDDRSLRVFFAIYFEGRTRAEIARDLKVTPQRISQIHHQAEKRIRTHPDNPLKSGQPHQGGTDDH